MMVAPLCCTVEMNSPFSHSSSLTTCLMGCPPTVPWLTSGYCVEEWLPQIMAFFTSVTGLPVFSEICGSNTIMLFLPITDNHVFGLYVKREYVKREYVKRE